MITTGMATAASRIKASTPATFIPCSSAVWVVRWIVGPSARGSENGTPTSMKSAPAAAIRVNAASETARVGNPAVRYGMRARRLPNDRQRSAIAPALRSDKVIADVDAVFDRVRDLHDGARVVAVRVFVREIHDGAGTQERAVRRRDDPDDGPVDVGDVGIGVVHERHFVRV